MSIFWSEFNWQAFATLVAGFSAVSAAWWIGRNQIEIQRRQTKLTENNLKIQLLEKRSVCIEEMRQISDLWLSNGNLSSEEWLKFLALFHKAQLLFPPIVTQKIDQALSEIARVNKNSRLSQLYFDRSKDEKAEKYLDDMFDGQDKVLQILPTLLEELIENARVDAWP